jgi:hypothetical protein
MKLRMSRRSTRSRDVFFEKSRKGFQGVFVGGVGPAPSILGDVLEVGFDGSDRVQGRRRRALFYLPRPWLDDLQSGGLGSEQVLLVEPLLKGQLRILTHRLPAALSVRGVAEIIGGVVEPFGLAVDQGDEGLQFAVGGIDGLEKLAGSVDGEAEVEADFLRVVQAAFSYEWLIPT